jgi:DNA polymerase III subunit gamma/tau
VSYQVLARKWRPRIFREMVGQEHVLKALINALDNQRLHHAYLFTGTRGVGKTTIARILAKCLNCEKGVTSEPCGQCSACVEIAEGRFVDLIEVDAASRTKVEDTRDLLDNVQYLPSRGRYKIYLIDEVHMLSNSSFNALLKTLEEPPEHVKFLLATTDPQKLPVTVLSRCLQFNLKNMSAERIVGHLQHVLAAEQVPFEDAGLWQLARSADGSMRDALSLTDQAIAFGCGKIASADVAAMLGTIDYQLIAQVVQALIDADGAALLQAVAAFSEHAPDYFGALGDLITLLHRLAIAQALPDALDNSYGDRAQLLQFSRQLTPEDVQLFYQTALMGRRDLHLSPDPRAGFEMTLLRMLAFKPQGLVDLPQEPLVSAVPAVEQAAAAAPAPMEPAQPVRVDEPAPVDEPAEPVAAAPLDSPMPPAPAAVVAAEPAVMPMVAPEEDASSAKKSLTAALGLELGVPLQVASSLTPVAKPKSSPKPAQTQETLRQSAAGLSLSELTPAHWVSLFNHLAIKGVLQSTAANAVLQGCEGNQLFFMLDESRASLYEDSHRQRLADVLSDYFKTPVRVQISIGALSAEAQTPAQVAAEEKVARYQHALERLQTDPLVQQLRDTFGAVLDLDTVKVIERGDTA